jgi:hypothetical protein
MVAMRLCVVSFGISPPTSQTSLTTLSASLGQETDRAKHLRQGFDKNQGDESNDCPSIITRGMLRP